jgi:preprotein translocase subunit YajC
MTLNLLILQENASGGSGSTTWIMIAAMFAVVYFFMIRPQVKKNKAQLGFRDTLKNGDKVITTGGIHGRISGMKDSTMVIDTEGGGKLKIERSAISMELTQAINKAGAGEVKK